MLGLLLLLMMHPVAGGAAQARHDPLTAAEAEELREQAAAPVLRVKLFQRFLNERSARMTELAQSGLVEHRSLKLHDAIDDLTQLVDELADNLDDYQGYETNKLRPVPDLRKLLPELAKSIAVWQAAAGAVQPDPDDDFALETYTEALKSLQQQVAELQASQSAYFRQQKQQEKQRQKDGGYVLP